MRGILVAIIITIIFGTTALLLWLQEKKRTDKVVGEIDAYYSMLKERRKTIRLKKRLNVICSVAEKSNSQWSVFSKDVSGEGMCLYLPEILPRDAFIDLDVDIPGKRHVSARGKVIWIKELDTPDEGGKRQFNAGIQFIKIKPKDKSALVDFINDSLKEGNKGGDA